LLHQYFSSTSDSAQSSVRSTAMFPRENSLHRGRPLNTLFTFLQTGAGQEQVHRVDALPADDGLLRVRTELVVPEDDLATVAIDGCGGEAERRAAGR
jgi:hypothetical protein